MGCDGDARPEEPVGPWKLVMPRARVSAMISSALDIRRPLVVKVPDSAPISVARLGFGLLTLAAILTQLFSLRGQSTFDPVNFFSYFTIDSNVIAAAVLLVGAVTRSRERDGFDLLRGAAVVYMAITGIVFTLLLSGTDVDTAIPWVNTVVHELIPLVMVTDWLAVPPRQRLSLRTAVGWLAFPLVWILYTMIRGAAVGRYPYPFLDPRGSGYASVVAYCVAILALLLVVGVVVARLGSAGAARRREDQTRAGAPSIGR
jgi:hypothetical protein